MVMKIKGAELRVLMRTIGADTRALMSMTMARAGTFFIMQEILTKSEISIASDEQAIGMRPRERKHCNRDIAGLGPGTTRQLPATR